MTDATDNQEMALHYAADQVLAQYLLLYQQLLAQERSKSELLPILSGHKAYSQNDEDGIVQEIFRRIGIGNRTFIEIGVGNGIENNTLYWLKQQWRGAWIEGGADNATFIRQTFAQPIARGVLHFQQALVSADNVNELVAASGYAGREIDLLGIDIDGNDYYLFEALEGLNARLVVIEYNARFPPPARWRIPYRSDFTWDGSDWFGASLRTMNDLFERRGYALVACNITGSNAFFVRTDLIGDRFPLVGNVSQLYQPPRYFLTSGLFGRIAGTEAISVRLDCVCD